MNIAKINSSELRKALKFAGSVVPTKFRTVIPVLGMVRLDVNLTSGQVSGTDLESIAVASFGVEGLQGQTFSVLIRKGLLEDVLRFAEGPLTIEHTKDALTLSADGVVVKALNLIGIEDWPEMPKHQMTDATGLSEKSLYQALRATVQTISTDETRYYLQGVYMHNTGDNMLTMVSTDGHRLSKYTTETPWPAGGWIVPGIACAKIFRQLSEKCNRSVQIEFLGTVALRFRGEGWEFTTKAIDGTFPDYNRVIPAPSEKIRFTLTSAALRRFPKTGEMSRAVKINPDAGVMSVKSPGDFDVEMPVTGTGGECGFNLKYLQGMAALSGTIQVSGADCGDPFRVLCEDPNLLRVIMPMRV